MVRGRARGALGLATVAIALPVAIAGAGMPDGDEAASCAPKLTILTDSQTEILGGKAIRAVVDQRRCEAGSPVRLRAELRRRGKHPRVTRRARTELGGAATSSMKLNGKGRKRVRSCERQRLVVELAGSGLEAKDRSKLKRDSRACRGGVAGSNGGSGNGSGSGGGSGGGGGGSGGNRPTEPAAVNTANAGRCDFLDESVCLHPFPNDHFTVEDDSTDTGRRVNFDLQSMPRNRAGVPINPGDYNRNDGFSPGNMIITKVPGLDSQAAFDRTGAVPITDIGRFDDLRQPVVVIDADTGERHPIWSEIDSNPIESPDEDPTSPEADGEPDPDDVNLLIRPAVNFEEGHRYIVALRRMRDENGDLIEARRGFELYRDDIRTRNEAVESRRRHFERIFRKLGDAGIERRSLFLAWDFTVASERNLSERALSIRDAAFAALGDENLADMQVQGAAPEFEVTGSTDDGDIRTVDGTITVPCYTNLPGCPPGSSFLFAPGSNVPQAIPGNTMDATFRCRVPTAALTGGPQAKPSLYGHGLLGSRTEVGSGPQSAMVREHGYMYCATEWSGFSTEDVPTVAASLQDLSNFPKLVDRMQQGFVNFMYLGRAMIHPEGFGSAPEFRTAPAPAGQSAIDTNRLYYDGNSQGGIMGGALTALAPDLDRAVLGVPGMNYSTLLRRSVDFDLYARGELAGVACDELPEPDDAGPLTPIVEPLGPAYDAFIDVCRQIPTPVGLYDNYPNQLERPLILSLIQMLWDRGEANGYAHHITSDPLANSPPHEVLLHPAFGDHQVATLTAEVEARTIGAVTNQNPLDPGRIPGADPLWNIPRVNLATPHSGSAIVYWDSGSPAPPTANLPPREGEDPHGHPRSDAKARQQKAAFLSPGGTVTEVCGGGPCYADGYTGAP